MHGLGNDFILTDCIQQHELDEIDDKKWSLIAGRLCDRRFGIGADQILLLCNSRTSDFGMRIFNSDGSEVEMCGNGIRCLAKYIWDSGLSDKEVLNIETLAGEIKPRRSGDLVKVDMGEPVLEGKNIPVEKEGKIMDFPLIIEDRTFEITCVSMGNPHAVIVVDKVDAFPVEQYGKIIEKHPFFPKRTNVEFIEIIDRKGIKTRVWERGAEETLACGTGASAVCVASALKGLTDRDVTIHLKGGDLHIQWNEDNHVYMTGPAVEVFRGVVEM